MANDKADDTPSTDAVALSGVDRLLLVEHAQRLERALRLAVAWTEEEEGFTLDYIVASDERQIARNGKHAWNERFVAMCRAARDALVTDK